MSLDCIQHVPEQAADGHVSSTDKSLHEVEGCTVSIQEELQ